MARESGRPKLRVARTARPSNGSRKGSADDNVPEPFDYDAWVEQIKREQSRKVKDKGLTNHPSGLITRNADISRARRTVSVWDRRILAGYVNVMLGEEGIGKGNLAAWVIARITRGDLPGDLGGKPRRCAIVGDEDAWDHVWVPRLDVAGADLDLCEQVMSTVAGEVIDLSQHAKLLSDYITMEKLALVFFDQLLDNLGFTDSWKDKQVRDTISPIRRLAQESGCALLVSMHPNKRQGSFRDRLSGTPQFNALSRSSIYVAAHPSIPGRVAVVRGKGNYVSEPPAFEFEIEEQLVENGEEVITTSRITDISESDLTVGDLLAGPARQSDLGDAKKALTLIFRDGLEHPAKQVLEEMKAQGFSERVAQKARRELEIPTQQEREFQGAWIWGPVVPRIRAVTGASGKPEDNGDEPQ